MRNAMKEMSKPCPFQNVSIELWRVVSDQKHIQDFEQPSYFNYFERCNKLSPDHFVYHSSLPYDPNETIVGFRHVVEDDYILRLCGCRRGVLYNFKYYWCYSLIFYTKRREKLICGLWFTSE